MSLSTDLEAYWDCTSENSTLGGVSATFINSMSSGAGGKFGDGWIAGGPTSYTDLSSTTVDAANWTVVAWAYGLRGGGYRALFFNGLGGISGGYHFLVETGTNAGGTYSNNIFDSSGTALSPGAYTGWNHFAAVFDGSSIELFVNGSTIGTTTPTWSGTKGVKMIGGNNFGEGFATKFDDVAIWSRALNSAEISDIYTFGNAGTPLSTLLEETQQIATEIATLVHDSVKHSTIDTLESTIVHDSVKHATTDTLIATTVHTSAMVSGTVLNITGTVSSSATWDATPLGLSTGSTSFQWEWQSVPAGSTLTSGSFQLPNSGSTTLLNMSGNTGLWHLDSTSSVATQIGSVGLVDSFGDGWQAGNSLAVSVNGTTVLSGITLAAGAGPEWYDYTALDGDNVIITFTPGAWASECSYILNSGSLGAGVDFYTSPLNPGTPYSFTSNGFSSGSIISTLDSSGQGNTGTVYGTTLTTNTRVGDYAFNFNGSSDYVELVNPNTLGIDGSESRTIGFWASASAWVDSTVMFSMGTNSTDQDFTFVQKSPNNLALSFWAGGSDLLVTPSSSTGWNHYFVVYDSSNTTSYIYQNNELLGSSVRAQNTSNANKIKIGEGTGGWLAAPHYSGSINEFAIWDRVLDDVDRENILFLQSGSCASGSFSGSLGLGDEFTFMPEVSGTYEVKLNITDGTYSDSGSVYAYITAGASPTGSLPIISGSNPTIKLVTANGNAGYVLNTYSNSLLSVQRSRTVEQVPFRIGTKGKQSLRIRTNQEFTGSS